MSYGNPPGGTLMLSHQGKTIGIGYIIGAPGLEALCLLEAIAPGQWEARWNSGFAMAEANQNAINAAGGEVNWIRKFIGPINAAIRQIFGSAPAPQPASMQERVNAAAQSGFTLTVGANGPVFSVKV